MVASAAAERLKLYQRRPATSECSYVGTSGDGQSRCRDSCWSTVAVAVASRGPHAIGGPNSESALAETCIVPGIAAQLPWLV